MEERDLVYKIADRAKELGDLPMHDLRLTAGYGCANQTQALQKTQGDTRGDLIKEILIEELLGES